MNGKKLVTAVEVNTRLLLVLGVKLRVALVVVDPMCCAKDGADRAQGSLSTESGGCSQEDPQGLVSRPVYSVSDLSFSSLASLGPCSGVFNLSQAEPCNPSKPSIPHYQSSQPSNICSSTVNVDFKRPFPHLINTQQCHHPPTTPNTKKSTTN